ncbi:MAG: DNA primase [Lachnospiraceae bacterium]|nr:DNA primase [Lachnospiraceae bacterium]
MPYYPETLIDEIRYKNDIVEVIGENVTLKKAGRRYTGLCPFHSEKSPSFSVDADKQLYYCFGCHEAGNVFTFIQKINNYTFPEAVKYLADRAHIELPEIEYNDEMRKKISEKERLLAINNDAELYFFHQLKTQAGALGLSYFRKRELTDETIKRFGLGYSLQTSNDLVRYLKSKGYDDEIIREAGFGVFYEREGMRDKFINRVMFPIQDLNGKVIGFGGRVMGDAKPKYLNSPENPIFEKRKNLFGLNRARMSRKGRFILCEGYMDVISMHQAGFDEAVASLGTAFTPEQAVLLKRFSDNIFLAYDSDGAGINAALKALEILENAGMHGRVINMQPHKDPDEFMKALGREEFEKRIDEAENGFIFRAKQIRRSYKTDEAHPGEKSEFEKKLALMLCGFEDEIERENYLKAAAAEFSVDEKILRREVISLALSGAGNREEQALREKRREERRMAVKDKEDPNINSERLLIAWLVARPDLYDQIKDDILSSDFTDTVCRKVAEAVFDGIVNDKLDPAAVINLFEDEEEQRQAAMALQNDPYLFADGGGDIEGGEAADRAEVFKNTVIKVKRAGIENRASGGVKASLDELIKDKQLMERLEKKSYAL